MSGRHRRWGHGVCERPARVNAFSLREGRRAIEQHGSIGASVRHLARPVTRAQLVSIDLEPGGVLGRHNAAVNQLFIVVSGGGWVSGGDGSEEPISAGAAAYWVAGESHETRAGDDGLRAIVLEGEFSSPEELLDPVGPGD